MSKSNGHLRANIIRAGARWLAVAAGGSAVLAVLAGCGGSGSTHSTLAARSAAAPPAVPPRVQILSPRPGARTGQTVVVRVRFTGADPAGSPRFNYVLDGHSARDGAARITLHDLASGRHLLGVTVRGANASATSAFIVRAPAAVARPPATTTPARAPQAPQAQAEPHMPAPTAPQAQTPPANTQAPTPPPAPHTAPPATHTAPAEGAIPQGNGGDMDEDNNGGPSDGDGNV